MIPSILIQLENGPNESFIFIFVSSSDPNLLRKKIDKTKQQQQKKTHKKKTMALLRLVVNGKATHGFS